LRNTIYESKDYKIKILDEEHDAAEMQSLCRNCSDYYNLHGVEEINQKTVLELFKGLPEGKKMEDKFVLGLFKQENLIGVIEGVKNYPTEGTWFIGQMMVDSNKRSSGLGASFFDEFQGWAVDNRVETLRLVVMCNNALAEKFWKSRGFEFREQKIDMDMGNIRADLNVYEKKLK
jgi:GNAT superfamily N-acetyltransferase